LTDHQDSQGRMDSQATQDQRENQEDQLHWALREKREIRDSRVLRVYRATQVPRETGGKTGFQDLPDHRVNRENRDFPEEMELLVHRVSMGSRVTKENLASSLLLDQRETGDIQGCQEHQGYQDPREEMVSRDGTGRRETEDSRDCLDLLVLSVPRESEEIEDWTVYRE